MADERINIKSLSRLVGVAPSTVSRILSGKARQYRIAAETEAKVMEKARELGFRPNYFAHSLNTRKTFNIGLVMANRVDSFLGAIIEGVESRLRDSEYQMVLATCENNPDLEQAELHRMRYRQVDGIVIYPSAAAEENPAQQKYLGEIVAEGIPLVIIGRDIKIAVDKVLFDDYRSGVDTALAYLAAGCRRFGVIALPECCYSDRQRLQGFCDTLRQHGIAPEAIVEIIADGETIEQEAAKLLNVDCLWAINTGLTLQSLRVLGKLRDISRLQLRGLGIEPFIDLLPFNFVTQPMPSRQMGEQAAAFLLDRINSTIPPAARTLVLPWPPLN